MKTEPMGYIPIIGEAFIDPIANLLEKLEEANLQGPNEVQASVFENGYSCSVILLTVVMLESYISRAKYVLNMDDEKVSVLSFFRRNFSNAKIQEVLKELLVIRDVIAHNHIWDATIYWDEDDLKFDKVPTHQSNAYGDPKFNKSLEPAKRKTKVLGLNLFPTRICWNDAKIVSKNCCKVLAFLEETDSRFCNISSWSVYYQGDYVNFIELINKISC